MSVFIDTNVLLYADDSDWPAKQERAAQLVANAYQRGDGVLSTQVLQEYYNAAVNKLGINPARAAERLRFFSRFETVVMTPQLVIAATDLHRLRSVSFWDAMILQAAIVSGCDTLFSEDMNAGEIVSGVKIVNPFLDSQHERTT